MGGGKRQENVGLPLFDVNFIEQIIRTDFKIEFAVGLLEILSLFFISDFQKGTNSKREDGPNGQEVGNHNKKDGFFTEDWNATPY